MAVNKGSSGWVFNYIVLPILVVLLIGASTAIRLMAKSEAESQDKLSTMTKNTVVDVAKR